MRTINRIYKPVYDPIDDLVTYRAIPTPSVSYIDPFLFLNPHGPQVYPPHNNGLPFGPHPHRGMETVTFIIDGDIAHYDSSGKQSIIRAGGVQWMTAGRGLIHAEVSSDEFKRLGGPLKSCSFGSTCQQGQRCLTLFTWGFKKIQFLCCQNPGDGFPSSLFPVRWMEKQALLLLIQGYGCA